MATPKRNMSRESIDKIKGYEALRLHSYPDPASPLAKKARSARKRWGFEPVSEIMKDLPADMRQLSGKPWTNGYGSTKGVGPNEVWTEAEADRRLDVDLDWAQNAVERLVTVDLNDFQYGALVSLVFNIGEGAFAKSTLLKRLNEGDYEAAAERFGDFVKARNQETGKLETVQGLVNRRAVEKAFFLRGAFVSSNTTEPVEVTPSSEKAATKDPQVVVPVTTATAATGAVLSEAAAQVQPLAQYSDTIRTVFVILTLIGIAITVYMNLKKRKQERE